jgi:endoglycosylceramidase
MNISAMIQRCCLLWVFSWMSSVAFGGAAARFIPDEGGRELVPGGFVAITEDRKGVIRYTQEDYRRMVRMGANFQVIRLSLGRLGGWPGAVADPDYPEQLDEMVRMGREAGLKTIFKLVVYGIRPFGTDQWDALWKNAGGSQDALLEAWRKIWVRYKEDSSVFGYDLLNEPQLGLDPDEQRCVRESLLPTLRKLVDAMHAVSPDKWSFYQPLFRDKGNGVGPFTPMLEPLERERVIYAPHMYTTDLKVMRETLDRYEREAALSKAPLLLGEWGPSVALTVDSNPQKQDFYTQVYQSTAGALDNRGIGGIKAWFCGSRSPLENKKSKTKYTWAIFSDPSPVGRVERKYLVDPLARPRPLAVAGRLEDYGFHFAKRTLSMTLKPDAALGATEVFVSADRFYPNGFQVEIGQGLVMALKPDRRTLHLRASAGERDLRQADWLRWDEEKQRLVIEKWVEPPSRLALKISPLGDP